MAYGTHRESFVPSCGTDKISVSSPVASVASLPLVDDDDRILSQFASLTESFDRKLEVL